MTNVALGTGRWSLWRCVMLRSAGFPVERVIGLRAVRSASAADELLAARERASLARRAAIGSIEAGLDSLDQEARRRAVRSLKKLRGGQIPETCEVAAAQASIDALRGFDASAAAAQGRLEQTFQEELAAIGETTRAAARDPLFREAIAWQNRQAMRTALEPLLRRPPGTTDSKTRQHEQLVANYLQRYCTKNETIGFFGPVGWASFAGEGLGISVVPGDRLLKKREVYFEYWGIDALAAKLGEEPAVRGAQPPRRAPGVRLEGSVLHYPIERTAELPEEHACVLGLCDGVRSAASIAGELGLEVDEVYALLEELVEQKLVLWGIELPTAGFYPAEALRAALERVEDAEARRSAIGRLDRLEAARREVAAAAGLDGLGAALEALETVFVEETGAHATRHEGQAYAGRTLVYEECVRDVEVSFGSRLLSGLAAPLELVLESARWYTYAIASRYRTAFEDIHRRIGSGPVVDFQRFWAEVPALFPGSGGEGAIVDRVAAELRNKWDEILCADAREKRIERSAEVLRPAVRAAFPAPGPGWPAARHHSPDILIAARPGEAEQGEVLFVLGELHTALNTVLNPFVVKEHPHPEELIALRELELPEVCVAPVWSKAKTRADYFSLSRHDVDLETGVVRSARPRDRVLCPAELVVEAVEGGSLVVRTRDGRYRFEVIAFFEHHLIAESYGQFRLTSRQAHTPRMTIDRLVIAREQWRFMPGEMPFVEAATTLERLIGARSWARAAGVPLQVFVKLPEETKPFFLDLESPLLVDAASKLIRKASAVSISEVLPAFDDLWLVDGRGQRYVSELRMAAVDELRWAGI